LHDLTPACAEVLSGTLDLIRQRGYTTGLPKSLVIRDQA
jgi:hypothetical protein